ncbi:MAG TPA: hypothetical protein VEQ59_24215 [Polyangiaceae bacterium]|nr:hypothetical protein [Polyangiaceae bacterium]
MSGIRWTTGVGIAVGGLSGAIVALLGAASARDPAPLVEKPRAAAPRPVTAPAVSASASPSVPVPAPSPAEASAAPPQLAPSAAVSAAVASPSASPVASAGFGSPPTLELPTTREGLLRAELYCDKRQDFDECARAAAALEAGSAGPADPEQAKRFRRIALTHLVAQCETGSAHACFVMATKYRAGTELAPSAVRAEALEKRGLELCRKGRTAPECPAS